MKQIWFLLTLFLLIACNNNSGRNKPSIVNPSIPDNGSQLRVEISKDKIVLGETISAQLVLYVRERTEGFDELQEPTFDGFEIVSEDANQYLVFHQTELDGEKYNCTTIMTYLLRPVRTGVCSISSASMKLKLAEKNDDSETEVIRSYDVESQPHIVLVIERQSSQHHVTDEGVQNKNSTSVSENTAIDCGPYSYDPAWDIQYTEKLDTLLYYPRDKKNGYFTIPSSVRVIAERAFQCNKHLKEITIPEGVGTVEVGAFLWSEKLQTVTIRGRIEDLPWRVFEGCLELRSIELPFSVRTVSGMAFSGCEKLRRIVIRAPEPPELEGCEPGDKVDEMWPFDGVDTDRCVVQVPYGSVQKYREAPGWSKFKHIEGNIKPIPHRWVELDSLLLAQYGITPEDISQWKTHFNRKFEFDDWEASHMEFFHNEDRYVAIKDLQNLCLYTPKDAIAKKPCILWRLLQYAAKCHYRIPESEAGLAHLMHSQIDSVVSYVAMSNADMGNQNALREYLNDWYYDFLSWQIQMVVSDELRALLEQEDAAWKEYHALAMKAFYTISDTSGSGFHMWYYDFGEKDMMLRKIGLEGFYAAVFPDARKSYSGSGSHAEVSEAAVKNGYRTIDFPYWGEDHIEFGLSTQSQMRAALNAEQRGWEHWMEVRAAVSEKLSGTEKEAWDNATSGIRKQKITLLKTAYNDFS